VGQRLEVLWDVEADDGKQTMQWFACTLKGATSVRHSIVTTPSTSTNTAETATASTKEVPVPETETSEAAFPKAEGSTGGAGEDAMGKGLSSSGAASSSDETMQPKPTPRKPTSMNGSGSTTVHTPAPSTATVSKSPSTPWSSDRGSFKRAWLLEYDARGEFPSTSHRVHFIDRASLHDIEFQARLTWRLEGQEVDRASLGQILRKMVTNMVEVVQNQDELDAESGENLETKAFTELAKFPFYVQQKMAMAYRSLADALKAQLRKKMEQLSAEKSELVITETDIHTMMAEIKAKQPPLIPSYF